MPDPLNPQTYDETELMDGTIGSVAVDSVGDPTVLASRQPGRRRRCRHVQLTATAHADWPGAGSRSCRNPSERSP